MAAMKTLLVHYLPSGEASNTGRLVRMFREELGSRPLEELDLLKNPAPSFTAESLNAYKKRNYGGQKLTPAESACLAHNDRLIAQFKSADVVVVAHPMHNFGMPGPVKTWLDAVEFHGETFAYDANGRPAPVMKGHKALSLYTPGGVYPADAAHTSYPNWDTLTQLFKINCAFMGFDKAEVIRTSLMDPSKFDDNLAEAGRQIRAIVKDWYGQ
jgi:FMN-dependent NADH-azoreductase